MPADRPWLCWSLLAYPYEGMSFAYVASVPHPSGLCRWWNLPGAADEASSFLRTCARRELVHQTTSGDWRELGLLDPRDWRSRSTPVFMVGEEVRP